MTKAADAFGNGCDWYARNPELCRMALFAKTPDGSSATECPACRDIPTVPVPSLWSTEILAIVSGEATEEPCEVGACTSDSECGCPGSTCRAGVCECPSGCESYGNVCIPEREHFGEPTQAQTQTQETWGWVLGILIGVLVLVLAGGLLAAKGQGGTRRRAMCFG